MKLSKTITIGGLIFALAPLLIVGGYMLTLGSRALEEKQRNNLINMRRSLQDYVNILLVQEMRLLENFSNAYMVQKSGEMITMGLPDVSQYYLDQHRTIYHDTQTYETFFVADSKGRIIADTAKTYKGEDVSGEEFLKSALSGNVAIGSVVKSKDGAFPVVYIASPLFVKGDGEQEPQRSAADGVIGVLFRTDIINRKLRDITLGKTGFILLLDKKGKIISCSSDDSMIGREIGELDGFKKISSRIIGAEEGLESIKYRQKQILSIFAPVETSQWSLVLAIPKNEYLSAIHNMRNMIIIVGVLFIIIVFFFTKIFFHHFIYERILSLTKAVKHISQGNLNPVFGGNILKSNDEIGLLGSAFREMTINLHKVTASRDELNKEIKEREKGEQALRVAYAKIRETQNQLIQSAKMGAVGQLASGVAHEVKNPLGIVLQGISYLDRKVPKDDQEFCTVIEMMRRNIKRSDDIIRALVDFSRVSKLKINPEDVNSVVESSLILTQYKFKLENIEIIRDVEENLPKVLVDKGKMEQVFVNLTLNALQSMPHGGKLIIRTYQTQLDRPMKGLSDENKDHKDHFVVGDKVVCAEIEDTGVGIPKEHLNRIFEPFFTTKGPKEGAGLGLAVTKNIIDMHKGLIEVESKEGKGTKFIIILKVA
ncbi:ATP-binding protein [Candidatus Omnitrophota bacterium]